jgi:hypothetical protein
VVVGHCGGGSTARSVAVGGSGGLRWRVFGGRCLRAEGLIARSCKAFLWEKSSGQNDKILAQLDLSH